MAKKSVAEETDDGLDDILNRSWDELPEERLLPGGGWLVKGRNAAFVKSKDEDKSDKILAFVNAVEPGENVDEDRLAEMGDYDFSQNDLAVTIYIEKVSDWKKKVYPFLAKFGIDMDAQPNIKSALKAFKNTRAYAEITEESYEDKTTKEMVPVNRVGKITALED